MKKMWKNKIWVVVAFFAIAQASCDKLRIDEDLSDCEQDSKINYELRLVTNINTELQTVLNQTSDAPVATALQSYLSNIFTDLAHDVNLSFYDTQGDSTILHHEEHVMNANQTSYTLLIPAHDYMHIATANLLNNGSVSLMADDRCHTSTIAQRHDIAVVGPLGNGSTASVLPVHRTGLFTARLPISVAASVDQTFDVHLYMANCATALVLDPSACGYTAINIYTKGFASDFHICDSLYSFPATLAASPFIRAEKVSVGGGAQICYCSVNYPSPESPDSRAIIETTEPFIAESATEAIWQYCCYVTLADGTVTESILNVKTPLRAGQLKIIKGRMAADGEIVITSGSDVGVAVTLNWNEGGSFNPQL